MTAAEFKTIRMSLGYSQPGFAEALGIKTSRTIQRYEAGTRPVPRTVVLLLESVGAIKPRRSAATNGVASDGHD